MLLRQLGLRGRGSLSPRIYVVGEVGRWLVVAGSLAADGPLLALAIAGIAVAAAPFLFDLLLFPTMHKGSMTSFWDFRSIVPWRRVGPDYSRMSAAQLEDLLLASVLKPDPRDQELALLAQRPAISKVLENRGKALSDLQRVEHTLIGYGLGHRIPRKVVSNPQLLAEYYDLEARGAPEHEVTRLYLGRFGSVT